MRWVISSSVRLAAALVATALLLLAVGGGSLRNAAVDTLPEFLPPQVQVQTEALGLSAHEVEQLVTVPLEDEFNGLAYLDRLRSQSVPGLSSIELTFQPGTDIYKARQLVTERVAQGPAVVNVGTPPVMIQPISDQGRAMMVSLSSRTTSLIDLSTLARWRIRPRLLAVPGVANVTIWGQRDQQLQVLVDPAKLHAGGVTLNQVINTTGDAMWTSPLTYVEASSPGADGFIDTPNQRLSVQHILPITTPQDLAKVPLEDVTGPRPIPLGSVTTVVEDHPAMRGDAVLADGPGFLLVVEKLPGANTLAVDKGIENAMADLRPGLTGITVDTTVFRPATFVDSALAGLGWAGGAGLLLLTLWLGLCWRSWRVAVVGLVSVTVPLVAAAYVLYLEGATFTGLTLLGLMAALGVIVDDAVAGVAALRLRRAEPEPEAGAGAGGATGAGEGAGAGSGGAAGNGSGFGTGATAAAGTDGGDGAGFRAGAGEGAVAGATGVAGGGAGPVAPFGEQLTDALVAARRPLGYALAVLLLAAAPLLLLPGFGGGLTRPMVVAYLLAVAASTVVALTVTPALAFLLLRSVPQRRTLRPVGPVERAYTRLAKVLCRPVGAAVLALALAAAALTLLPQLSGTHGLMPEPQDRDLLVQWQAAPGTSLPAMERTTGAAGDALRAVPGVRNVASNIGQSLMGDQIVNVDSAQTWVTLAPNADYTATRAAVGRALDGYHDVAHTLLTYSQLALQQGAAADEDGDQAVRVRLYGSDPTVLDAQAERLRRAVSALPGITGTAIAEVPDEPSIEIATDVDRAARYGLKPGDIRRATAVLVAGIPVGSYYQQQQIFDVTVWSTPAVRADLGDLRNLLLDTPAGGQVALKDVATVSVQPAPAEIDHDQASRYLDITAAVHGQGLDSLLPRVQDAVRGVELPLGYHAEVTSGLQQSQDARLRVLFYVLACAIGVLLLFQAALRSWSRALLFLLSLPLALAGGVLGALIDGSRITAGALTGFLLLFAVAVRGGLTVLHALTSDDSEPPGEPQPVGSAGSVDPAEPVSAAEPLGAAAGRSVLPVLCTAVGLALLLLPFTLRGDIAGMELARPFALVVLGGLVSTTLVTLFLLPALHRLLPGSGSQSKSKSESGSGSGSQSKSESGSESVPGEVG